MVCKIAVAMQRAIAYDVVQMQRDLAVKGWRPADLARRAGVAKSTVTRFLEGRFQSPPTAKKLAGALGYSIRRYLRFVEAA